MSLSTAVDFALRNDPRIKMAQAAYDKARASLSEAKDAFVPAVGANGGIGKSAGVPLGLPVVFSVSAQSLAFNFSQPDYIRAAKAGTAAADFALKEARVASAEEAVTTYISLDNALRRMAAIRETEAIAAKLTQITQDRFDAGMDSHMEITRTRRIQAQMHLQELVVADEIATLSDHLAKLTGIAGSSFQTVHESIPQFSAPVPTAAGTGDSYAIQAASAGASAKTYVARGDHRYLFHPQLGFEANYSRISLVGNAYSAYYPGFDPARHANITYNSLDIGLQITVPILDLIHQAKAKESAADARQSRYEVEVDRMQFLEGRLKLEHAAAELVAREELASLDRDYAQDQLDTILLQLQASSSSAEATQLSPKDEQNGRLQEREKFLDYLNADLQLRQTEITLMRQQGTLGTWIQTTITAPSAGVTATFPVPPATPLAPRP